MHLPLRFSLGLALASTLSAQTPCFDPNVGVDQNMLDDQILQGLPLGFTFTYHGVGYTSVCLDSNGSIYLGATTTAASDFSPTEVALLNSPQPRICGLWSDFQANALGSGHIFFNAVPASGGNPAHALFTWDGVFEYHQSLPITIQVRLDANNVISVFYGANAPIGGTLNSTVIIGASPGLGAASNPVSFQNRPLAITQDNFADVRSVPGAAPSGFKMSLSPLVPGYFAADDVCLSPAHATVYGSGCPTGNTIYETLGPGTMDLSGRDFTLLPAAGAYQIIAGIAGPMFTGFTNNLGAGDDTTASVPLPFTFPHHLGNVTNIHVCSNGFLTLGLTNPGTDYIPTVAGLLSGETRVCAYWTDLNASATGSGGVFADLDPTSGDFVVTWNGIAEYVNQGPNTFQVALSPSGVIKIRYGAVANISHTVLCGYSDGLGANDPGSTDLSSLVLAEIAPGLPLRQDSAPGSRPQLGTTFQVDVSNISPTPQGNLAIMFLGFVEQVPPIPLGALGATSCNLYFTFVGGELTFVAVPFGAPTASFSTFIPNTPAFNGVTVYTQVISDDTTANAFGWKLSNGLRWYLSSI